MHTLECVHWGVGVRNEEKNRLINALAVLLSRQSPDREVEDCVSSLPFRLKKWEELDAAMLFWNSTADVPCGGE